MGLLGNTEFGAANPHSVCNIMYNTGCPPMHNYVRCGMHALLSFMLRLGGHPWSTDSDGLTLMQVTFLILLLFVCRPFSFFLCDVAASVCAHVLCERSSPYSCPYSYSCPYPCSYSCSCSCFVCISLAFCLPSSGLLLSCESHVLIPNTPCPPLPLLLPLPLPLLLPLPLPLLPPPPLLEYYPHHYFYYR